jgi:(p)ppGpp synthase/HD superfamily hydrolase
MAEYTKKQGQYLAFIHCYTKLNGVPPAEADMQRYFRATPPSVHQMIVKLEEKGLISRTPNSPRTIKVTISNDQIPELGKETTSKSTTGRINWSQESYSKAYRFAAEAHNGQLVLGTNLPYIMHISFVSMEVLACLRAETYQDEELAVQCALLHDVVEDTHVTFEDVKQDFGVRIANGVRALTKNTDIAKEYRMQDSLQRIRQEPVEVWIVKLADRITNLAPPPVHWEKSKIKQYREEAIEIHQALREASHYLSKRLEAKIEDYARYL